MLYAVHELLGLQQTVVFWRVVAGAQTAWKRRFSEPFFDTVYWRGGEADFLRVQLESLGNCLDLHSGGRGYQDTVMKGNPFITVSWYPLLILAALSL